MNNQLTKVKVGKTYEENLKIISDSHTLLKVHAIVNYWKIGKVISAMELDEGRYGTKIIPRVASDLAKTGRPLGSRILQEAHRVSKTYPTEEAIQGFVAQGLEWSHIRGISRIPDKEAREEFTEKAIEKGYNAQVINQKVSDILNKDKPTPKKTPAPKVQPSEEVIDAVLEEPPSLDSPEPTPAPEQFQVPIPSLTEEEVGRPPAYSIDPAIVAAVVPTAPIPQETEQDRIVREFKEMFDYLKSAGVLVQGIKDKIKAYTTGLAALEAEAKDESKVDEDAYEQIVNMKDTFYSDAYNTSADGFMDIFRDFQSLTGTISHIEFYADGEEEVP